jgi:hypothetical protein
MKMTTAGKHFIQIPSAEFPAESELNFESADRSAYTAISEM